MLDKLSGGFQSTIEKDGAGDSFENVGEQSMLATPAALLFSATETNELAELKCDRSFRQSRSTHQSMLHAREFAFGGSWVSLEEIFSDDEAEN